MSIISIPSFLNNLSLNVSNCLFQGGFSQLQVDSIEGIMDEFYAQGLTDIRQLAYLYATAFKEAYNPRHPETRLTPMREFGGETYLKSKPYYPYVGMGFSQLTHKVNYQKESLRLGLDLVAHPEMLLDVKIASNSHVFCMSHGTYTGRKLSDYINPQGCNFFSARKIVNSLDCAQEISDYAKEFLAAMQ